MLTNAAAKAAGPRSRAYKLHDQGGLHLLVRPAGSKSWQLKYRIKGREKLLTLGRFPEINVARARILQAEAKEKLERGVDPGIKVIPKAGNLEQLARSWYRHNRPSWSRTHAADVLGSLERDVFPDLGAEAADAIEPPALLCALRAVEKRGCVATAQRIRQRLTEIFDFGIAGGIVSSNPAQALGAALKDAPPANPHPALTQIESCRELLQACEDVPARPATRLASRFVALTAVRLDAVRGAKWDEFDLEARIWTVPPARTKLRKAKKDEERFAHIVPLSAAAIIVLAQAARESGVNPALIGASPRLVFPGRDPSRPIGEGAIGALYQRAGFTGRHVPHGWRASFSTILNEQLGEAWAVTIDAALGHAKSDKVEAAYNRAQMLDRRRELFDRWGDLLSGLSPAAT